MQGIRRDEEEIGAMHAGLRRVIDDLPIQAERYLRSMVSMLSRSISGASISTRCGQG